MGWDEYQPLLLAKGGHGRKALTFAAHRDSDWNSHRENSGYVVSAHIPRHRPPSTRPHSATVLVAYTPQPTPTMRFSVPRSLSPSPVRKQRSPRKSGTFRAPSISSDSEGDGDENSNPGSSSDTSEPEVLPLSISSSSRKDKSVEETNYIADAIASIRLAISHHDPYEEWSNQTRREARRTARSECSQLTGEQKIRFQAARARDTERLTQIHQRSKQEIEDRLSAIRSKRQAFKQTIDNNAQARAKKTRDRIEAVIRFEEDRQRTILEEQRLAKEAEERKAREEEAHKQFVLQKEREEKLKQDLLKAKQDAEELKREQDEKVKSEKEATQTSPGLASPSADWATARDLLKRVKRSMKDLKANPELKKRWSGIRRAITPKIGQLTNDENVIRRVCEEILNLCSSRNFLDSQPLYVAVLSSLSKTILLQAEVEVTAEKRSAIPLARVTSFLVQKLDRFPQVFYMKLVQRTGGWPIPVKPPPEEGIEYSKLSGFREDESLPEYTSRVAGLMRVYFQILITPTDQQANAFFRPTIYWTYFARLMCNRILLESGPVGPELLATALDVGGVQAREIFGKQWHKLMELLYSGLTETKSGNPIGGTTPEGTAARIRALLEVEKVMNS